MSKLPKYLAILLTAITVSGCGIVAEQIGRACTNRVKLTWDRNAAEEKVEGYRVFVGDNPRDYGLAFDAENEITYKVGDLKQQKQYFAVTAYARDQESDYSDELVVDLSCENGLLIDQSQFKRLHNRISLEN